MSDDTTEVTEQDEQDKPTPPEGGDDPKPEDELPAWARKKLANANSDAAKYRTRLRDIEKKMAEAGDPAELKTALEAEKAANLALHRSILKRDIAAEYEIGEFADAITGDTEDEMKASAKKFAASLDARIDSASPGRLRGGLDASDSDDADENLSARELARKYM